MGPSAVHTLFFPSATQSVKETCSIRLAWKFVVDRHLMDLAFIKGISHYQDAVFFNFNDSGCKSTVFKRIFPMTSIKRSPVLDDPS